MFQLAGPYCSKHLGGVGRILLGLLEYKSQSMIEL